MAVITIGIDPELGLGPVTLAWHGITIALGILLGAIIAARWLRRRGLDVDPLYEPATSGRPDAAVPRSRAALQIALATARGSWR